MLALREGTGFLQGKEVSLCLAKVAFDWDGNLSIPSFQWKHDIQKGNNYFFTSEVPQGVPNLQRCILVETNVMRKAISKECAQPNRTLQKSLSFPAASLPITPFFFAQSSFTSAICFLF
jgi:hypothetical protein